MRVKTELKDILDLFEDCAERLADYEAELGNPRGITRIKVEIMIENLKAQMKGEEE